MSSQAHEGGRSYGAGLPSAQVAWTEVLEFVRRRGIDPTKVLIAGTPVWSQLPDDHPDKLAAVLAAGVHHSLRVDAQQTVRAEASRAVSATPDVDWSRVARQKPASYIERRSA